MVGHSKSLWRSVDLETKLSSCNFSQKTNERICFLSWQLGNTGNLNFDFKFQVFLSHQDRKTNSFWEKFWLNKFVLRSTDHPRNYQSIRLLLHFNLWCPILSIIKLYFLKALAPWWKANASWFFLLAPIQKTFLNFFEDDIRKHINLASSWHATSASLLFNFSMPFS